MTITISKPTLRPHDADTVTLAANVADDQLWFRVPAHRNPVLRGEPFVACLIIPAMKRGGPLVLDDALPISPEFLAGVQQLMEVFSLWGEDLGHRLRPVEIDAPLAAAPPRSGTLSYFSGGIDGLYTLVQAERAIDVAVFGHGIDFQLDNPTAHEAARVNREWLASRDIPLIEFATNARFVGHHFGIGWNVHNGICLGGVAHALEAGCCLIAAGQSWHDWHPTGTHPITDPMLSHETTRIEHADYGPPRWRKLMRVADEPGVLAMLRVCWQDKGYNCGRCEKCRRTMLLLHLLELDSPAFPATTRLADALPTEPPASRDDVAYLREARELAHRLGRTDVVRILDRRLRRWTQRRWLVRADAALLGGALKRLRAGAAR